MINALEAVEKIHSFDKFGGGTLGLERIEKLMEMLGNPQDELKFIHVAGTNGKGSVCKYIYEVLEANGYKVGLYTSPFIEVFNERIEFDHKLISDEDLGRISELVFEKVEELKKEGYPEPTEFEVITAVAFLYFKEVGADFVVLEVGLGGRLDATNVIKAPLVSVITSISFDHMERLGDTLAKIAFEKAGIIKPDIPVVSNVAEREAAVVIARRCYELGCVLHDCTKAKYGHIVELGEWVENPKAKEGYDFYMNGEAFDCVIEQQEFGSLELSMIGEHQVKNAICALTVLDLLRKKGEIELTKAKIYEGIKLAKQPGRLEILSGRKPVVILDGAHNEDGALVLKEAIKKHFAGEKILMLTGILKDKDVDKILESFGDTACDFVVTCPENPRRMSAEELSEKFKAMGKNIVKEVSDCKEAARFALDYAKENAYDILLVAGSLYLVGSVRPVLRKGK